VNYRRKDCRMKAFVQMGVFYRLVYLMAWTECRFFQASYMFNNNNNNNNNNNANIFIARLTQNSSGVLMAQTITVSVFVKMTTVSWLSPVWVLHDSCIWFVSAFFLVRSLRKHAVSHCNNCIYAAVFSCWFGNCLMYM